MAVYFISDLHLKPEEELITKGFLGYLKQLQATGDAEQLYILGDFFELWIGDDYTNPYIDMIQQALNELANSGCQLFFMHGNRDFLVGEDWAKANQCTLLDDPYVLQLGNQKLVLMHGDSLCLEDVEYQKMRALFRSAPFKTNILSQTIDQRLAFAQKVRGESQSSQQDKSYEIMDVTQSAVDEELSKHGVDLMIHGHTHRPNTHQWEHEGQTRTRIVLGDWTDQGWQIRWTAESGFELSSFDLATIV